MATDFDSPWKEAIDVYLEQCFELLFPAAHSDIDWTNRPVALDKELQQIAHDAKLGRRYVDKLYEVRLKRGGIRRVLLHLELQVWREAEFEERMFVYNYRAFDQKRVPVASFAILADNDPNWRPTQFGWTVLGCSHTMVYVPAKLLDWAPRWNELESHPNPFGKVVLAHLKTLETSDDPAARQQWKVRLVRALYEQGLTAEDVRKLFRFIDWLMDLPPGLDRLFWQEFQEIQETQHMPYISTPQRIGRTEGMSEAIEILLQEKFGEESKLLFPEIEQIYDADQLRSILRAIPTAKTLEELRKLWAPQSP